VKPIFYLLLIISTTSYSQTKILIQNKSFEDNVNFGWYNFGWHDCGTINFPEESPPDIHSDSAEFKAWGVEQSASDQENFLGMVVRDNETCEAIAQELSQPIKDGMCYKLSLDVSVSENYLSRSRLTAKEINYNSPCILRIWCSNSLCNKFNLLAETSLIENNEWKRIDFKLSPKFEAKFIMIEAYWKIPIHPYCGHILIDNLSDIEEIDCNAKFNTNY
jgi:hypothetical protein